MINYATVDDVTGLITSVGVALAIESGLAQDGETVRECGAFVGSMSHWWNGTEFIEYDGAAKITYANRPQGNFAWSPSTGAWIDNRTIGEVRSEVLEALKFARDSRINGGFVWDGSTFDSDTQISQPRLLGLFTTAIAGGIPAEGYPWRLKDNSWRVLSAADAQGVWGAFQMWMASHFAAFATHEATVLAETDIDALRSYDTEADWP